MSMRRRIISAVSRPPVAGAVIGVIALSAGAAFYAAWTPPPHTVYLRSDGFHPESILIEPGQTITFVNKTSHAFWPASNAHPQHDRYATFDAGQPLAPGASFAFTFEEEGAWGFHDHLRSYYTGTVYVGEAARSYDCLEHLQGASLDAKRECWDETLQETLRSDGAQAAFKQFAMFYASDPDFAALGCHAIAHKLGDVAYGEYVKHGNDLRRLEFPPESLYCGYGYYHGILEHMIRDNPDFRAADAFCTDLIREHEDTVPRIKENCYHAIGHGFIPEPSDVEAWGNPRTLPEPAILACRNLADAALRAECLQGAFNVVADWMATNQFGLRLPSDDPLSLCRAFDTEVSSACYYELSMKIAPLAGSDIVRLYDRFAASIEDDAIADMVMNSAVAAIISNVITEDDFIPYLRQCRELPARVAAGCLRGITGAFVAHGEPEQEYVKALAFCGDEALTDDERDQCYANIFRTFRSVYSREKVADLCTRIDPAYEAHCAYDQ